MSIRRLRTPRIKINRTVKNDKVKPAKKNKVFALDKYSWEDYYAERNYYYGENSETRTDE